MPPAVPVTPAAKAERRGVTTHRQRRAETVPAPLPSDWVAAQLRRGTLPMSHTSPMPGFLTVREAARRTGKSPSSIRRVLYPILQNDAHPDRQHIEPSVEEAL